MCRGLLKQPEGEGREKKAFGNEGIMVVIKENLGKKENSVKQEDNLLRNGSTLELKVGAAYEI